MSLTDILTHHAERFPESPALEFEDRITSWAQLLEGTREAAGALKAVGVDKGDVVAVLLHNSDAMIELMHATSHVGAIFMPLNWRLAGPELAYIIDHSGARVLVTEPEFAPLIGSVEDEVSCTVICLGCETDAAWQALDALRSESNALVDPAPVAESDVLRLMYTSGTTARPKGVMITYANLYAKNISHVVEFGFAKTDVNLACGPLYHVGALDLTTTTMMYVGASSQILRRFDAEEVLGTIERKRVSHVWLAPAMITALVTHESIEERVLSSVRLIIDGGEKMPLPLIETVLRLFPNVWFCDAYGLTETVSGDTFLDKAHSKDKLGSVGKPVIHSEVAIVDQSDRQLPAGEAGEIVIRGPKVCKGYWRNEKATEEAIRNGWFHTGDIGVIDQDGYLFIVDRLKDMILSGGENVASSEVERVLYEHEDVLEAAVVGRPHERWGEVPVAYVVPVAGSSAGLEELMEHCSARLARFKVPKDIIMIDELPRNPSGKVLKRTLRDRESAGERQVSAGPPGRDPKP